MSKGWLEAIVSPALKERITLVGLCDVDPKAAERRRDEFKLDAAVGENLDALLTKTKPDLLFDVVIPGARHAVVSAGLSHGCHVLSEKPMAPSIEEGRDLVARASAARQSWPSSRTWYAVAEGRPRNAAGSSSEVSVARSQRSSLSS
jgi:predicted dehydrogenase